jgi:hypothetical protein
MTEQPNSSAKELADLLCFFGDARCKWKHLHLPKLALDKQIVRWWLQPGNADDQVGRHAS